MKYHWKALGVTALAVGTFGVIATVSAKAANLADGRTLFDHPPDLVEATTLDNQAGLESSYHFVIEMPADAGEALEAVVIEPLDHANDFHFNHGATGAQLSTAYAQGPAVELSSVGGAPDNPDEVLIVFADPVQPGETVTVTLENHHNPRGGVYLFGVTAYPEGENGVGQFLGYGRIQIYDADN